MARQQPRLSAGILGLSGLFVVETLAQLCWRASLGVQERGLSLELLHFHFNWVGQQRDSRLRGVLRLERGPGAPDLK
jgi:hypothetical protein